MDELSPAKKERVIHDSVLEHLKKNPKGLTMTQLVEGTGFSRKALEKHLQVLALENEIYIKQFGITKAYYPNHRVQHLDFEKMSYDNKIIWFNVLEGEQGLYLLIRKKKKTNGDWVHEHSFTVPLEKGEQFLKTMEKVMKSKRVKDLMGKK